MNVSYNCLERNLQAGNGDKTAIIFEADDGRVSRVSYQALYEQVCQFANGLKKLGHKKGERAIIYMPMSVKPWSPCRHALDSASPTRWSSAAFLRRVCKNEFQMRGQRSSSQPTANTEVQGATVKACGRRSFRLGGCDAIRHVVVYRRTGGEVQWNEDRDVWMHDVMAGQPKECEPEWVDAEHRSLFSIPRAPPANQRACSTRRRIPAVGHPHDEVDLRSEAEDVFWCTADVGWVTGHTYVAYGPLAAGGTEIIFEGVPTYPDAGRFWKMIADHKVSIFYTAPTAIRALIKAGPDLPGKYDLSSLRLLGSVGEPINPEAWMWYYNTVGGGRCPIVDTWWQTETGGHMITPLPGVTPLKPGSCTKPLPGIDAAIVDETGADVEDGKGGILVIKRPWPSMIRTIWGDPERFKTSYYPDDFQGRYYLAGDGANRDLDGYFWIMGRIDDVLNVSGHRLGTMEIESALVSNPLVAEAAVVGRPDDLTGEAIAAFVVLKQTRPTGDEATRIAKELREWVAKEIGAIAKPKEIRFGENLPKPDRERSCGACCVPSPRARRSPRMCRLWKTPASSSSSNLLFEER